MIWFMECIGCQSQLSTSDDVFFYVKGEKDIHLSIKPEVQSVFLQKKTMYDVKESKKKHKIKCNRCHKNIGSVLPFGPNGTSFYAFGLDAVILCRSQLSKKQKWWEVYRDFTQVDKRDPDTFYGTLTALTSTEPKEKNSISETAIVLPSLENLEDFEWTSVSLVKKPRDYQIEAYVEALQKHLIVVIPTGAGKTLIASMYLGRMCSLNPGKMGVVVVDRIPLVFQQGNAIRADTNLRVAPVCGENRTSLKMKRLRDGHFDVLVVTAGAFSEMMKRKDLDPSLFCAVVFDECHHMSGGHKYVEVLEAFTKKNQCAQPRILGLTASPVSGRTRTQFQNKLDKFLKCFPNGTKIFAPRIFSDVHNQKTETEIEIVPFSKDQRLFLDIIITHLNNLLEEICESAHVRQKIVMHNELLNSYQIVGELRALEGEFPNEPAIDQNIRKAFVLIDSLESGAIMGIPMACQKIYESDCFHASDIVKSVANGFKDVKDVSPRLQKLRSILEEVSEDSKILVFVDRRSIARLLVDYIKETFESFEAGVVVGHGGYDGMGWEGEQEDVLRYFSEGVCNLLVCTSVLEEGLDVASCDLVVRFTGVQSLVQFIQSRGRARKEGSRFIVFQSEAERYRKRDVQEEEDMLKIVLKEKQNMYQDFSLMSKDIIEKIKSELETSTMGSQKKKITLFDDHLGENDFTFKLYVDHLKDFSPSEITDRLIEMIEDFSSDVGFRVIRILRLETTFSQDTSVVKVLPDNQTHVFLLGARCQNKDQLVRDVYTMFCRVFSFELVYSKQTSLMWAKRSVKDRGYKNDVEVAAVGYGVGNFINKSSAVLPNWFDLQLTVQFSSKEIILKVNEVVIHIPLTSIGKFTLLSMCHESNTFKIATILSHPPMVRTANGQRVLGGDVVLQFVNNPALFLSFDSEELNEVRKILNSPTLFPSVVFDANLHVRIEEERRHMEDDLSLARYGDILWMLKCIDDSRAICMSENFKGFLLHRLISKSKEERARVIQNLSLIQRTMEKIYEGIAKYCYFSDIKKVFNDAFRVYSSIPDTKRDLLDTPVPDNHFLVKRIVVTPSRVVLLPAVPVTSNRLLRMQDADKRKVVIVSFKEEHMGKMTEPGAMERAEIAIVNGIIINDIKYYYLCSTASQLRAHKGYFIAAIDYNDVLSVRRKIVPNVEEFTLAAKYLARLGLYGTADTPVMPIKKDQIAWIQDGKAENNVLTTDGAGKISKKLVKEISEKLDIEEPSCFQIRYSGSKGILVATDPDDPDLQGKPVAFRDSMKKFENDDNELCIVLPSKIYELCLNREVITLLSSIKSDWGLTKTLMMLQEDTLKKFGKMFMDIHTAQEVLKSYIPAGEVEKLRECSFEILDEAYWFEILQGVYRLQTSLIRHKTSIPLEKGCILIGVPDPYGVLADGEVFIQLKRDNTETEVLNDPVLIFRNPCLHPGDIRRVKCVYKDELKELYNVVVFPAIGCSYSLASVCSGGDLDGDKFGIIWHEDLVPEDKHIHAACDYEALSQKNKRLPTDDVTNQEVLARFYLDFMKNDSLGRVAHKHLALCDILDDGARDPLAIKLAESQSQAVDYPKTGVPVEVPSKALDVVEENGFPDFMEKTAIDSYKSKKVLGELYRRCKSVTCDFDVFQQKNDLNMLINMNLLVEGNEAYLTDAVDVYRSYAHNMDLIMAKYQLEVEADIVLGQATHQWSPHLEADKGKASDSIKESYAVIVKKYRDIFFSDVHDEVARIAKASAWYRIVNDPEIKIKGNSTKKYLSFPWVIGDVLCDVRSQKQNLTPSRFEVLIGESALALFKKNSSILLKNVTEKLKFMKDVENEINKLTYKEHKLKDAFLVTLYGSTSIYLCEPESDVDICVLAKQKIYKSSIVPVGFSGLRYEERQRDLLKRVISRAIDSIVSSKREVLDQHVKVPVIKCTSGDEDNPLECDISMNETGLLKTLYIHCLYKDDPVYLPVFWVLVRWARITGLVKSLDGTGQSVMDTADFYILMIHFLKCKEEEKIEIEKPSRWAGIKYLYRELDELSVEDHHCIGKMIYKFFRRASEASGNMSLPWPTPDIPDVDFDQSQIRIVAEKAAAALHCLAATRDVNALEAYILSSSDKIKEFSKMLSISLSYHIGGAPSFHAAHFSQITGAKVSIEPVEGKHNYLLKGNGTAAAISNLRAEIKSFIQTNKALVLGRLPQKSSRYFMEGSSILIVKKDVDPDSLLKFSDSYGPYELLHQANERSNVFLKNPVPDKDSEDDEKVHWKDRQQERLLNHVMNQLSKFPSTKDDLKESLEISVRFGCFYLIDIKSRLPDSQTTMRIRELELASEKGRRSRVAWKRGEFKSTSDRDDNEKKPKEEDNYHMVKLKPATGAGKFAQRTHQRREKQKNVKRGVATAFTPGLLKQNIRDQSARESLLKIYRKVLSSFQFKEGSVRDRRPHYWKISMTPSSSYEVQINLDKNFKKINVTERSLHWVHGTIISGEKQDFTGNLQNTPDVRLQISTTERVKNDSELYKSVIKVEHDQEILPISVKEGNKPFISQEKTRKKINSVRHCQTLEMYTNGIVDASIVYGDCYFGENLKVNRPFCELSLYFDREKLIRSIDDNLNDELLGEAIKEIFDTAIKIQDKLAELIKKADYS